MIPTLLTALQPLLEMVNVCSVLVLPALVVVGFTIAVKFPRVVAGVEMDVGAVTVEALRVPVADPLTVNGLVAPAELT